MLLYKVTYKIDHLDNEPDVEYFDTMEEAHEWLDEEIARRVDWVVSHSQHSVSREELQELTETEVSLSRIQEEYVDDWSDEKMEAAKRGETV